MEGCSCGSLQAMSNGQFKFQPKADDPTSAKVQMDQSVCEHALTRPQHASPTRITRQTSFVGRPRPAPRGRRRPIRHRGRCQGVTWRRTIDDVRRGSKGGVVCVGTRNEEIFWDGEDRSVLGSIGAPDSGAEVIIDCAQISDRGGQKRPPTVIWPFHHLLFGLSVLCLVRTIYGTISCFGILARRAAGH